MTSEHWVTIQTNGRKMVEQKPSVSKPFTDYERNTIFDVMDDLRDSVRFSDGGAGYPKNPDNATRLLRRAQRKLAALI